MDKFEVSRRDFLKLTWLGLAAVAMSPYVNKDATDSGQFAEVFHSYSGEANDAIKSLWVKYGINTLSQKVYQGEPNLPWPKDAILFLPKTLDKLPKEYFETATRPIRLYLMRKPGTSIGYQNYAGGFYANSNIALFIPESYDINGSLDDKEGRVYASVRNQMLSVICHEFTHSYVDSFPEIMTKWNRETGWQQNEDKSWSNREPQNLLLEGGANKLPSEDLAVSAGRMLVNPHSISENRRNFFKTTVPFEAWVKRLKLL